tara:strand:- start:7373 stop:8326 length:954 start_codon:yes stop_codon:yes gene_type:complete
MVDKKFDIVGIGNSIVDVILQVDDNFLHSKGLRKGLMSLVDLPSIETLTQGLEIQSTVSGGSVANSIVCLAQNDIKCSFIGKVANDALGKIFIDGLEKENIFYGNSQKQDESKTGRCVVMVTGDAQRTMSTYLGISQKLNEEDVNEEIIKNSQILYLEGYLWDLDNAQSAIKKAILCAKTNNTKIAFSISDVFCVERFRDSFLDMIRNDIDIVFANEQEIKSLFQKKDFQDTLMEAKSFNKIFALTRGEDGATIINDDYIINLESEEIENLVDTTGAGDLFAAGFLEGFINKKALETCGKRGIQQASKIIQKFGARL